MLPWIQKIPAFIPHQSPAFPEPPLPLPSPKLHSLPLFHSVFVVCASESVGGEVNIWSLCLWNWKVPPSRGWRRGGFVSFALSGSYIKTFLFQRISSLFFRVQYFPCMQILLDTWFIIYIYFYIYAIFQTIGFPPYSNDWLMMQRIWQVNKGGKTIYATSHTLQIVNLVLISWEIILPRKVIVLLCKIFPYYFIYIFLIIVCDKLLPDIIVFIYRAWMNLFWEISITVWSMRLIQSSLMKQGLLSLYQGLLKDQVIDTIKLRKLPLLSSEIYITL